ncbi:pyridoxamine 5'-phosphate oxidase [Meiothermus hypogaeus]|uniref:Pyridoxine/pyridoxamine 5'-phosphate oxidase n=2 Tax=Meiothermus hypogaeus TaxID=884155 RepID=A0A511R498_9DEIN|nr:pyridoxamine 5'-phosphate oxidase [Meiothermus hypogaeus]RIH77477.1 Pyridoxine/pyridoxamine 5'-phosphate oxidase [Meiothermus hypogaeus]GEM84443.1 pyridoxine/pyridoxamine 5'-phosphate oxidase [Meiothermus hypogaeus NBRC 106114]GIW35990.1 MAG: pyridoxine/pyridoxamine 5'-phosphate oxidase [Meiothermus sp.]
MLRDLRSDYTYGTLSEQDADPNPFRQLERWLSEAIETHLYEPHGMTLSTVGANGRPSSRVVLLRGLDEGGLVFFSNYHSRKGQELEANPWACLNFWWPPMERQVRIEGRVEKVEPQLSDEYFASRPYDSQIGSAASPQSQVIAGREVLEERIAEFKARYPETVPRPAHWGGYRLKPDTFEFWQGRPSRLHDRLVYRLQPDGGWTIERLAP